VRLRAELAACYADAPLEDPVLQGFQSVVRRRALPRGYAGELVAGMAMDVEGHRYRTIDDLLTYCYRAAGTVGLMMCHVMGVRDDTALRHAAHLGIAMQLTNICRDVAEDWDRGRIYLPATLLAAHGAEATDPGTGPIPEALKPVIRQVVEELLSLANKYYESGDRGLAALEPRCRLAVTTARYVYAAIGRVLARRRFDPLKGRAYVTGVGKLWLMVRAWFASVRVRTLPAPTRVPQLELLLENSVFAIDGGAV